MSIAAVFFCKVPSFVLITPQIFHCLILHVCWPCLSHRDYDAFLILWGSWPKFMAVLYFICPTYLHQPPIFTLHCPLRASRTGRCYGWINPGLPPRLIHDRGYVRNILMKRIWWVYILWAMKMWSQQKLETLHWYNAAVDNSASKCVRTLMPFNAFAVFRVCLRITGQPCGTWKKPFIWKCLLAHLPLSHTLVPLIMLSFSSLC